MQVLDSPWKNGYIKSFNARLRDELLDGEIFYTLKEAKIVIESIRNQRVDLRWLWMGSVQIDAIAKLLRV